jgi:hypothetical protein
MRSFSTLNKADLLKFKSIEPSLELILKIFEHLEILLNQDIQNDF